MTTFTLVSRAPLAKLEAYKARRGWTRSWVSSYGSDFNYDFHVTLDPAVTPAAYNYRGPEEDAYQAGIAPGSPVDLHGLSVYCDGVASYDHRAKAGGSH